MPTLDWIGKKAVLNHHREVPFRLLKTDPALSVGDPDCGNLLVQGDNLVALKALLPYYAGQVKCIYIDPPYNTGNENWTYNDAVNSPEMRAWLGKTVGREAEDLSRHDKWLCMMYPRLCLLRQFLRDDGAIFISIDDNEVPSLRHLMDEIFGGHNFVASIVWQKRTSPDARLSLGPAHDYVVVYARDATKLGLRRVPLSGKRAEAYKNPDNDPRGPWASVDLTGQTGHATSEQFYEITTPAGRRLKPPKGRCWAFAERTMLQMIADNRIWFGTRGANQPRQKKFLSETEGTTAWTWWPHAEAGHNQEATKELNEVMNRADVFDNPKPTRLLKRIVQIATDSDSLVLDSFAGSGTTAHAALTVNKDDGGSRRFLLVEMEREIATKTTAERIRRVVTGYVNARGEQVEGKGGGFRFVTLGEPLFDETGNIRSGVRFADLAAHVFFVETGLPLPKRKSGKTPLLGVHNGVAVYLLFNGILGDKTPQGGNVLTRAVLEMLPPHDGPKVIFGTGCRVGPERLRREGVTFRQIPYAVRVE